MKEAANETAKGRIGIFGGSFNPIHKGHINSMLSVAKQLKLEKVKVIPANESPNRIPVQGPSAIQRYEMVKRCIDNTSELLEVDDIEILRGGTSYTIDTLRTYFQKNTEEDFYLIVGLDQFLSFDQWRDYDQILNIAHLVVTSRPGESFPQSKEELPKGIQELVVSFDYAKAQLNSGKEIHFVHLEDMDISATEIRKRLRLGDLVEDYLPPEVETYIQQEKLYEPLSSKIDNFKELTKFCTQVLFAKKGIDVRAFDVSQLSQPSEFNIIASGTSTKHSVAMSKHVVIQVKKRYGVFPQNIEGQVEGNWIVLDYGSLMVHIFYDFKREEYRLENLWQKGEDMQLKDEFLKLDDQ